MGRELIEEITLWFSVVIGIMSVTINLIKIKIIHDRWVNGFKRFRKGVNDRDSK